MKRLNKEIEQLNYMGQFPKLLLIIVDYCIFCPVCKEMLGV